MSFILIVKLNSLVFNLLKSSVSFCMSFEMLSYIVFSRLCVQLFCDFSFSSNSFRYSITYESAVFSIIFNLIFIFILFIIFIIFKKFFIRLILSEFLLQANMQYLDFQMFHLYYCLQIILFFHRHISIHSTYLCRIPYKTN